MLKRLRVRWIHFWMGRAGLSFSGRIATRLAALFAAPYYGRIHLSRLHPTGYIDPGATIHHSGLRLGRNVLIGDRVVIYRDKNGGPVELGDGVHLYGDTYIQTGSGGSVQIGPGTHVQPRCQFSAYLAPIQIGANVEIAPNCAFYPYDHGIAPEKPIRDQPLQTKGPIIVGDDAWLGVGTIVLSGARIGKGAVIGAGSVVTGDIPDGAIAFGVPARVRGRRGEAAEVTHSEPVETAVGIRRESD